MNLTQLIARTRSILGDKSSKRTNGLQWPDSEVLQALNSANDTLWNRCLQFDEGWGQDIADLQTLGVTLADLGGDVLVGQLPKDVQHVISVEEGWTATTPGIPLTKLELHERFKRDQWSGASFHRGWWQGGDRTIYFTRRPSVPSPSTIRLWFHRAAPEFARFMAVSPSTTSLTVEIDTCTDEQDGGLGALIPRTNYYRNSFLECVDAGGALPETQEVSVSSFGLDGTLGHPFWTFVVSSHTVNAQGAVWATVPMWPTQHHELLCLLAAYNLFTKGGDDTGKAIVNNDVQGKMAEFVNTMEARQMMNPRHVNYRG